MKAELFERYVHQVGRRLPRKQRPDVEAELYSLLMDGLEVRTEGVELDKKALEAQQAAILQEMGSPELVADQYRPRKRYIVGPRLFDIYAIVVATVSGALALAFLIAFLIIMILNFTGGPVSGAELLAAVGGFLSSYIQAILAAIGSITIVFAILERVLPDSAAVDLRDDEEEWDPLSLPAIEQQSEVSRVGLVFEIGLMVAALLLFNVFSNWAGIHYVWSINDAPLDWQMLPILSPAFFTTYLPLLNVAWLLHIGLNIVLLLQGRWQRGTRLAQFVLSLFDIYILYRMVTGPSPVTFVPNLLRIALTIALVVTAITALYKLYLVIRGEKRTESNPMDQVGQA